MAVISSDFWSIQMRLIASKISVLSIPSNSEPANPSGSHSSRADGAVRNLTYILTLLRSAYNATLRLPFGEPSSYLHP